jgi:hypothetical protein
LYEEKQCASDEIVEFFFRQQVENAFQCREHGDRKKDEKDIVRTIPMNVNGTENENKGRVHAKQQENDRHKDDENGIAAFYFTVEREINAYKIEDDEYDIYKFEIYDDRK